MGEPDELERLAERGRRLAEREPHRGAASTADEERLAARRRLRAAVSRYVRWGWWVLGGLAGALTMWAVLPLLPAAWHEGEWGEGDRATGVAMLVGTLVAGLAWLLRPAVGERAIAHEEAWVRSLPFPLTGYLPALADGQTEGAFVLELTFGEPRAPSGGPSSFREGATRPEPPPDFERLADVFRTVRAEIDTGRAGPGGRRSLELVHRFEFESSVSSNAYPRAWVHEVVPVLLTLHARHPIREVHVHGFRARV